MSEPGTRFQSLNLSLTTSFRENKKDQTVFDLIKFLFGILNSELEMNPILAGGQLTQQYFADYGVRVLRERYEFARTHQEQLKANQYTGVDKRMEDIAAKTNRPIGTKTILPATVTGSPRWMAEQYRDAMAMMMHMGRPDIFLTMTCNPAWPEIKENLPPGKQASECPALVARVFDMKKKALLDFIMNG